MWFAQSCLIPLSRNIKIQRVDFHKCTNIKTDLNADSLTVVELLFELEQEYNITIPDDVMESLETVGGLVEYLEKVIKE